jgi:CBS domain-containing protein
MVIRFVFDNLDHLGSIKNKPLKEIDGAICKVISVKSSKTIEAFNHMVAKDIGGVAVVDDHDQLVGALSLRDIKLLSSDLRFFWRLHQSGNCST